MKVKALPANPKYVDINSEEAVEEFRKGVAALNKRLVKSPELARKFLIDTGIYTKTGKISKNYR